MLEFYEDANKHKGGGSYARYIINVTRDFCQQLSEDESRLVLHAGTKVAERGAGRRSISCRKELDDETLRTLDRRSMASCRP